MIQGYGWILRAIPFAMLCSCASFGAFLLISCDPGSPANRFIVGHVVAGPSTMCLILFCTASIVVLVLTKRLTTLHRVFYPVLGYATTTTTAAFGFRLWRTGPQPYALVAGHVVFGLGCIAGCVSTVALVSIKFVKIPDNAGRPSDAHGRDQAYPPIIAVVLCGVPGLIAVTARIVASPLDMDDFAPHLTAGHALAGLAAICTCLIGLVASVVRQEQDRRLWPIATALIGLGCVAAGACLLATARDPLFLAPAWVLHGLGLVCWFILSKAWLLAVMWRLRVSWAGQIPPIPTFTAMMCRFAAAFLFQGAVHDDALFIPARVMAGLGSVCFTLFSIIILLESGTSHERRSGMQWTR